MAQATLLDNIGTEYSLAIELSMDNSLGGEEGGRQGQVNLNFLARYIRLQVI